MINLHLTRLWISESSHFSLTRRERNLKSSWIFHLLQLTSIIYFNWRCEKCSRSLNNSLSSESKVVGVNHWGSGKQLVKSCVCFTRRTWNAILSWCDCLLIELDHEKARGWFTFWTKPSDSIFSASGAASL